MEGLKPQTIESINLLKQRKTPFVVAVNQIDRLFGWKTFKDWPIQESLKKQDKSVLVEYEDRLTQVKVQLAEQGLNSVLYYKNKDFRKEISLVPTSAHTGEGIPDLLLLLVQLTQHLMADQLLKLTTLQATVLEVKKIEGYGNTIDVILANGTLYEGDKIVLCGMQGPIVTTIRSILSPEPLRELRLKSKYEHLKEARAALGVKIAAHDLENAISGSSLYRVEHDDQIPELEEKVMSVFNTMQRKVDKQNLGVYAQASSLGSLEALLEFLHEEKVPVAGIAIGVVHKKDVMKASIMLEKGAPEYACILAFDVKISQEAKEMAVKEKVTIFDSDIIYSLTESFAKYIEEVRQKKREAEAGDAVFPCVLEILPEYIFNVKNPIVIGVHVKEGVLKTGTRLCIPGRKEELIVGTVVSIEKEKKEKKEVYKGDQVAIKIETEGNLTFGRQFDEKDELYSHITKKSLNALKKWFSDFCSDKYNFSLLLHMKKVFGI